MKKERKPRGPSLRLSQQQVLYCEELLIHGNGRLAYQNAYPGTKYTVAISNSTRFLRLPAIANYLDMRRKEIRESLEITPEKLIALQAERAQFSPTQLLDPETGHLLPLHRLPDHVARQVTKFKVRQCKPIQKVTEIGEVVEMEQRIIEIDWDNGNTARESLMKVFGLYEKDNRQKAQHLEIYNQIKAQIEKEMVDETFEEIEEQNYDLAQLDEPDLTK